MSRVRSLSREDAFENWDGYSVKPSEAEQGQQLSQAQARCGLDFIFKAESQVWVRISSARKQTNKQKKNVDRKTP